MAGDRRRQPYSAWDWSAARRRMVRMGAVVPALHGLGSDRHVAHATVFGVLGRGELLGGDFLPLWHADGPVELPFLAAWVEALCHPGASAQSLRLVAGGDGHAASGGSAGGSSSSPGVLTV